MKLDSSHMAGASATAWTRWTPAVVAHRRAQRHPGLGGCAVAGPPRESRARARDHHLTGRRHHHAHSPYQLLWLATPHIPRQLVFSLAEFIGHAFLLSWCAMSFYISDCAAALAFDPMNACTTAWSLPLGGQQCSATCFQHDMGGTPSQCPGGGTQPAWPMEAIEARSPSPRTFDPVHAAQPARAVGKTLQQFHLGSPLPIWPPGTATPVDHLLVGGV